MLPFALSAAILSVLGGKAFTAESAKKGRSDRRENFRSADLFIILTCEPQYGRFRTTTKMERRGPKTSTQCPLVSENVQLFDGTFVNFARAVGRYGSSCSSLRGMPEMLHSLFDRVQSVQERFVSAPDGPRFVYRMDALLLLRIACQFESLELQRFGTVRGFGISPQSGLWASRRDRANAA